MDNEYLDAKSIFNNYSTFINLAILCTRQITNFVHYFQSLEKVLFIVTVGWLPKNVIKQQRVHSEEVKVKHG